MVVWGEKYPKGFPLHAGENKLRACQYTNYTKINRQRTNGNTYFIHIFQQYKYRFPIYMSAPACRGADRTWVMWSSSS